MYIYICMYIYIYIYVYTHTHTVCQDRNDGTESRGEGEKSRGEGNEYRCDDFQLIIEAFTSTLCAAPRQPGNMVGTVQNLQTGKFKDAAGRFAGDAQQLLAAAAYVYET